MESMIFSVWLCFGLYSQAKKNKAARDNYNSAVDKRFAYVAQHGICYVYEPNYHKEVMYATKVIRSEKAKQYIPIHIPIYNNTEGEYYEN